VPVVERWVNETGEDLERSNHGQRRYYNSICLDRPRAKRNYLRIGDASANIKIELLPVTGLKDYWCVDLLSHHEEDEDDDDDQDEDDNNDDIGLQFL